MANIDLYLQQIRDATYGEEVRNSFINALIRINNEVENAKSGQVDQEQVAAVIQEYLAANPLEESDPTVPAWAKQPEKPTYIASEVGARPDNWTPTAQDVNADPSGTADNKVAEHNANTEAHNDIRMLIEGLASRLNALADSDDTTLDQMSEVVAYIKSNKSLIDSITTSKVNVSDIIDNLTTNVSNKPLSAAQGVVIKTLIDALRNDKLDAAELTNAVNTALAQAKASGEFDGQDGATPNIQIGTVETLAAGSPATASMGGTPENPLLNLGIPQGASGSGGSGIAVSGATVGQTVRIAAVDDDGVPTAWESVDFSSGGDWRLIADIILEKEVKRVDISTDMDGNPFALKAYYLIAKTVSAVNTEDRFTFLKINVNGESTMKNITNISTSETNVYVFDLCINAGGVNPIHFAGVRYETYNWTASQAESMSPYYNGEIHSMNSISICPNDYAKVFGGAGTEIKLYGIDI